VGVRVMVIELHVNLRRQRDGGIITAQSQWLF